MKELRNAYNKYQNANQAFRNASRAYHIASHHTRFIRNVAPFMSYAQEHQYIHNARNAHERMIRAWKARNNAYWRLAGKIPNHLRDQPLSKIPEHLNWMPGGRKAVKLALLTTYRHKPNRVRSASPVRRTRRSPSYPRTL